MNTLKKLIYASIFVLASYNSHAQVKESNKVNITSFTVGKKANKLIINWSTDGTIPTNYFEVQRSDDGNIFKTIALVLGPDPKQTGDNYQFAETMKDNTIKPVYFRVCHVNASGEEQITKMIQL
jgi:hypothetical protein